MEKTNSMNSRVQFLKRFSSKFSKKIAKIGSLSVPIRNNFKNIIFITCKWSKICKYYVNSMVIPCSTCQKEEKECMWVKYLIYALCHNFKFVVIYTFFSAKTVFQKFQSSQKSVFFKVCQHMIDHVKKCYERGPGS